MSAPAAIEVIVMSAITSETKASGKIRKVTFLLPNDGEHPFAGMVGDRLHIVPVRIMDDETPAPAGQDGEAVPPAASMVASPSASKKAWHEMKPSQQAALRCKDARFQTWMGAPDDEDETARRVRSYCTVRSRAHIDDSFRATERWERLDGDFLVQTGLIAEAR